MGATLYSTPQHDPAYKVAMLTDDTEITITCYVPDGPDVSDNIGNHSPIWLGVQTSDGKSGFLPDVNVSGGYTEQQLMWLGLKAC